MKAQIAIIAITAFLQVSAVPFLSNNRPSLLGSLQENVNNVISQGQDIIEKGKEEIEDAIDKGKEVISEHVEDVIDNLEDLNPDQIADLIEEFPLSIDNELLVSPNEIIAEFENGISNITPEQVPTFIQENFPDISLSQEDAAFIVEELQNLQQVAVEAINENFALHNTICSQIRNAIKKSATAFIEQITKLVHSFQSRVVNLIEKGEVFPSRALDVMEKSANDTINAFEKVLKGLGVPEGIVENAISVMREATEKNIEIARTYYSYIGGSRLGEIVEEIKTAISNGLPADMAVRNVFTNEIESAHQSIHNLRVGNGKQISSRRGFFGDIAQGFAQLLENERLQEEIYEMRQRYEYNIREIQARIYSAMVQVSEMGENLQDGFFQYEVPEIIENTMSNIRDNFQIALENVNNFDDLQIALGSSLQDMEAEIGKVMFGIMQHVLERIQLNIGNVMGALEEISINAQEGGWGPEIQQNQEFEGGWGPEMQQNQEFENGWGPVMQQNQEFEAPALYNPDYPGQAAGSSFSGNPDWSDPDRIFLTLI